jgi:outer membrane protein assembly factor BamB
MRKRLIALPVLVLLGTVVADLSAANWPRFRGPNGTGIAADKNIPVEFGEDKNLLWKTAVPGVGHSSPIVWENRLFMESASPDGKDRLLVCIDTGKGKVLWSKAVSGSKAHTHAKNSLASSTPATDGERIYTSFWDGQDVFLHAFDFKGKELWKRDMGSFKSQHGSGGSPVVWQDKVFFNFDQDGAAAILAFDAKTGKPLWQKTREPFRACYSTPFLLEKGDTAAELIVSSTAGVTSYKPDTGDINWDWVWKFNEKMPQRTVGSPIFSNGLILANSGDGSGSRATVAVQPGTKPSLVWSGGKSFPYVPTMLTRGEYIYFVNDRGLAACHEAKTGTEVWNERLGGSFHASPVLIDGKVYAPGEDGFVYVFAAEPQFKLLAKNALGNGEYFVATPAVANGQLYIRGKSHLYCIGKRPE